MLADRFRVPRWLLQIDAIQPLLQWLRLLRQRFFLRPEERAQQLLDRGQPAQALGFYRDGIEAGRRDLSFLVQASHIFLVGNRVDWARETSGHAVRLHPGELEAWRVYGLVESAWRRTSGDAPAAHGHAAGTGGQSLIEEDPQLLAVLAQPPVDDESLLQAAGGDELRRVVERLRSENTELATGLDLLRQQLGHRDALDTWIRYSHTSYYMRNLSLLMRKDGVTAAVVPAVAQVPEALRDAFAMNGKAKLEQGYLNGAYPAAFCDVYTDLDVDAYRRLWRGEAAGPEDDRQRLKNFKLELGRADSYLRDAAKARLRPGDKVAVIESRGPVYEALCVECGARPTTVRRMRVDNRAAALETLTPDAWEGGAERFDAAVAVRAVELAGLGMFGEPIDPDGDLALMRRLRAKLKPGGILLLVIPTGHDTVVFNATRVYGPARLPLLLDGWREVARQDDAEPYFHGSGDGRSVLVLENRAA